MAANRNFWDFSEAPPLPPLPPQPVRVRTPESDDIFPVFPTGNSPRPLVQWFAPHASTIFESAMSSNPSIQALPIPPEPVTPPVSDTTIPVTVASIRRSGPLPARRLGDGRSASARSVPAPSFFPSESDFESEAMEMEIDDFEMSEVENPQDDVLRDMDILESADLSTLDEVPIDGDFPLCLEKHC